MAGTLALLDKSGKADKPRGEIEFGLEWVHDEAVAAELQAVAERAAREAAAKAGEYSTHTP